MHPFIRSGVLAVVLSFTGGAAHAQFKEIKAAPYSPAVARQKIRTLLAGVDFDNRDLTVATISDWLKWYRDIADEELIARWKSDGRANMPLVMTPLADARVAREVVEYSWHVNRAETFTLDYAAVLGDLMARYPESAKPFLDDLQTPLSLSQQEAQGVCRILMDMPDIGTWRRTALQVLPRYRAVVDQLSKQDADAADQEKRYRALRWRADLRLDGPAVSNVKPLTTRGRPVELSQLPQNGYSDRPHIVSGYSGALSGIFESSGGAIPQNGEIVFRDIPQVKLMLDFDTKHWEARLAPGEGQGQVLVLRNIGKGPQKKCVVKWSVMP